MRVRRLSKPLWKGTLLSLDGWMDDEGFMKR